MRKDDGDVSVVIGAISALSGTAGPGPEMHHAFAGLLRWSGVPQVYAPPYFWAPRSRPAEEGLLSTVQDDAASWADDRLDWRQAWAGWAFDPGGLDAYRTRRALWQKRQARRPPVRPSHRLCLPLFAAYACDIAGLNDWAIGDIVGMGGTVDKERLRRAQEAQERQTRLGRERVSNLPCRLPRFRGMPAIITKGRQLAHDLGAWPWSEYPSGELPARWQTDEHLHAVLRRAAAAHGLEPGRRPGPPGARIICVALLPL